jgi:hypothetical protein
MKAMLRRSIFRLFVFVAGFGLVVTSIAANGQDDANKRGRKYKLPMPTSRVEVTILRDFNGKPIENAAVVFHPMAGDKDEGNMELKTNEDGKAIIDVLPLGYMVRLQVIAKGYQTYGEDYKIDRPSLAIEVKMKRPGAQYSIYEAHDGSPLGGGGKPAEVPPAKNAPPPATPPAAPPAQPQHN